MAGKSSKSPTEKVSIEAASALNSGLPLAKSIKSVSVKAKRRLFMCAEPDIEDYANLFANNNNKKKKAKRVAETLLDRFRSKRGLFVTDVSKTEWCEKQMEFSLFFQEEAEQEEEFSNEEYYCRPFFGGGRNMMMNKEAIRAGTDRHVQLHQEIQEPVRVKVKSCEDFMAVKLVNFLNGVNQLESEGLTRELPIVSFAFAQGIWMVGKIDEIRMLKTSDHHILYFPCREFYDYFELSPQKTVCEDLIKLSCDSGFPVLTLDDLVVCYRDRCMMLPRSHDQVVLRYESLLDEDHFTYDGGWLKGEIRNCLEFWLGQREATVVAEDEEWKCGHCHFVSKCHAESSQDFSNSSDGYDSSYYC